MATPGRLLCSGAALLALLCASPSATAKDHGVHSPGGRKIYSDEERFADVLDQDTRRFVVEAAAGAGPEGNIGVLLGWLNQPFKGIEWYAGFGQEWSPARHYTGTMRWTFNISGYRPYVAMGYLFHEAYGIGTYSHNAFTEVGYKWVIHHTYHLTLGASVRRIFSVHIEDGSTLNDADVDPVLLDEQVNDIFPWVPMAAVRFSRAF